MAAPTAMGAAPGTRAGHHAGMQMPSVRSGSAVLALVAGALAGSAPPAQAEVTWLCRPGLASDPCEIPLDTTVREPGGGERVETPARAPQDTRAIDCFYVYPTVSNQPTRNADKSRDPELVSIAKYQAARFSTQCRVFAPVYRQVTIAGLAGGEIAGSADARRLAYSDVVEAWREYLARHNRGRGVVLIGHSQGTRMLRALIKREIDPRPERRRLMVGGLLLGGNVTVRRGQAAGGDFRQVRVCTRRGEVGCVVAYSTFSEDPPEGSRYGRVDADADDPFGFPSGPEYQVACTDPGRLSGMTRPFGITVPTEPFAPGPISLLLLQTGGPPPTAPTTWVRPADRYQGGCREIDGAHVLRYDPVGDSRRPRPAPEPGWGTHIVDVNLGLERQVAIVAAQARGWLGGAGRARCLPARGRVRGRRLGPAVLGHTRGGQRLALRGARLRARRGIDRYCVSGGGALRIGYPTRALRRRLGGVPGLRERRALLILSSSRGFAVRGVRPGLRVAALRRRVRGERRVRSAGHAWYVVRGRGTRAVYKTRSGRVREVGIAEPRLTRGRGMSRRFLGGWPL